MKSTVCLILIYFFYTLPSFGLNFSMSITDSVGSDVPGAEIVLGGFIHNLTDDSLDITMIRETNIVPSGWSSALCLELCAPPWISRINGSIAGRDSLEFSIHFFTSAEPGEGTALLAFNEANDTSKVKQLFTAKTTDTAVQVQKNTAIRSCRLIGNYPNPFNQSTVIQFEIGEDCLSAKFQVFDITGRLKYESMLNGLDPGEHQLTYSGYDQSGMVLSSGNYWYTLIFFDGSMSRQNVFGKFTLLK